MLKEARRKSKSKICPIIIRGFNRINIFKNDEKMKSSLIFLMRTMSDIINEN